MNFHIFSRKTIASILTIAFIGMISPMSTVHAVASISEITPIPTLTNDSTPSYTFSSNETGDIAYAGPCNSTSMLTAVVGNNTITFDTILGEGFISTCTIQVNNVMGTGNILTISSFTLDVTAPTITLQGNTMENIGIGAAYSDSGAYWDDGTGNVWFTATSGSVNNMATGTYILEFAKTDAAGNVGTTKTRTVNVTSGGIPTITLSGSTSIVIASGSVYVDSGATANDPEQGDITPNIITVNNVNTSTAGAYTVTYNVTDGSGNTAATVIRNVTVNSSDNPEITLSGSTPVYVEQGDSYVDAGATASDVQDGDSFLTPLIVVGGLPNTNSGGTYLISYDVNDTNNNPAITVYRTVIVRDTTIPLITLSGASLISITKGDLYTDSGASWTDTVDGSGTIVASGTIDTSTLGDYTLSYSYIDAAGNTGTTVTRTVRVGTGGIPVITLSGSATVNVLVGSIFVDPRATAYDAEDRDITASGSRSGALDTNVVGVYTLIYSVTDSDDNTTTAIRIVNVITGDIPVITLNGSGVVNLILGSNYTESGATVLDTEDGTGIVLSTTGTVNTGAVGTYTITYTAVDAQNNTVNAIRTVNIIDVIPPVISLIGSGDIIINGGSIYTDSGAIWIDNIDGSGTLTANGVVNTSVAGLYVLSYNYTDSSGNTGTLVRRNVTVLALASIPFTGMVGGGGGAGAGSSTYGANFNSAPSSSDTASENMMIPNISRLLKRSNSTDTNSAPEGSTRDDSTTHEVLNPITDYICPVIEQLHTMDDAQIMNVSEGEYTTDVQSLLMYRGLDNADLSTNFTQRYFVNKGFGIAKSNEAYNGDRPITRAEFIKMLVRALSCHYTLSEIDQGFSDVDSNTWYTEYVNFATENGWINGYENGTFGPHNFITRGEMAKILGQAIQIETDDTAEETFYDVPMSNPFASYIYALKNHGIIDGKTELFFDMNSNVSRNEVAKIFHKTFLNIETN